MKSQIITVAHTKGGVGKSTLVWHLAGGLNFAGEKVTVLDLDFQQTASMASAIRAAKSTELAQVSVVQIHDEVELAEFFNSWDNGILLVDVGGFDSNINRLAIQGADQVLTPLKPSTTELLGFKAFELVLEEIGTPKVSVIFNNAHPSTKNFEAVKELLSDYPEIHFLESVVRSRTNYDSSIGAGLTIHDLNTEGTSKVVLAARRSRAEIDSVIEEVCRG